MSSRRISKYLSGLLLHNEIDYICIDKKWHRALQDVRSFRGADIGSDHYLVGVKAKLKLKTIRPRERTKSFDIAKLKDQEMSDRLNVRQDANDLEDQWQIFQTVARESAERHKKRSMDYTRNLGDHRPMQECQTNKKYCEIAQREGRNGKKHR